MVRTYQDFQNDISCNCAWFCFLRSEIHRLKETKAQRRLKDDHTRTMNDWQRMNLRELKVLPEQSRYHVKKAIMSYLGTSKGSNKALKPLLGELSAAE